MQQAVALAIVGEFLLKRPKDFGTNRLELEAGLIDNAPATFNAIAPLAFQFVRHQPSLLGQGVLSGTRDFRQCEPAVSPRYDMTSTRNLNPRRVVATLDVAGLKHFKQFGVQSTTIQLKRQFGDFGV